MQRVENAASLRFGGCGLLFYLETEFFETIILAHDFFKLLLYIFLTTVFIQIWIAVCLLLCVLSKARKEKKEISVQWNADISNWLIFVMGGGSQIYENCFKGNVSYCVVSAK